MLRLIGNLDTKELSRNSGRKCLKDNYLPKSKQFNSWPFSSFNSFAFHISQSLKIHFSPHIILQSTHFTGLLHFTSALKEFNARHLLWISPGLVINPKITKLPLFHPKPQEILPIQNSKYQGPGAVQVYFTPLRVHISHSHSFFLSSFFVDLYICFSHSLLLHSVFKLLKNTPSVLLAWHGEEGRNNLLTLPLFQHCWSADPDWYSLNNNHFPHPQT